MIMIASIFLNGEGQDYIGLFTQTLFITYGGGADAKNNNIS